MGRGTNLGNTLEPPTEGEWNNGPAQEFYFDDFVAAGFGTVRVPVRWDRHTATTVPFGIEPAFLSRVEEVVDWGLDRGLFVILNAHHEDWLKNDYGNAVQRARFDSIWSQVAVRFKDKSDRLLFEIINEPFGMTVAEVDDLNARILGIVRESNPTRLVVYSGNEYSGLLQLKAAAVPDDPHIIGYYHSYDPWEFAGLAQRTWGTPGDVDELAASFADVAAWSDANNVPVIISEFGAVTNANHNSRMHHYARYVEGALKHGIAFQVWDDGGDFEVYDRSERKWSDVKDILIHNYVDSPTLLMADAATDTLVSLSWTNRTSYNETMTVERRVTSGEFVEIAALAGTHSSFADTTISAAGPHYYRVSSQFGTGFKKYSYPILVNVLPTSRSSFGVGPFPVPGTIEAEDYDIGGEGLTYHDTEFENIPGAYRPTEGVDVESRTDGGFHVAYVESEEWLEYTVDVREAGSYLISTEVASLDGGGRFRFEFSNSNSNTVSVPDTDSWQTTTTVESTVALEAGEQVVRLFVVIARPFNIDRFAFSRASGVGTEGVKSSAVELKLYPNPSSGVIAVQTDAFGSNTWLTVYNLLGQEVNRTPIHSPDQFLDLGRVPPGIYVVRLTRDEALVSQVAFVRT